MYIDMTDIPEPEVLAKFRDGDNNAGDEIFLRYRVRLYAMCLNMMRDSDLASDMVQETFFKLLKFRKRIDVARNFSAFIHKMAYNICLDELRKRRQNVQWDDFSWIEDDLPPTDDLAVISEKRIKYEQLWKIIEDMPMSARTLLELRYRSELTPEEIAQVLEAPPSTVRVRLHRARKLLAGLIAREFGDENETSEPASSYSE